MTVPCLFFFDSANHLIAATREWQAVGGNVAAVADSLQAPLTHVYGAGHDCDPPRRDPTGWPFMQRQWSTPQYTIQLVVGPSGLSDQLTDVTIQFVRVPLSCRLSDFNKYMIRYFLSG